MGQRWRHRAWGKSHGRAPRCGTLHANGHPTQSRPLRVKRPNYGSTRPPPWEFRPGRRKETCCSPQSSVSCSRYAALQRLAKRDKCCTNVQEPRQACQQSIMTSHAQASSEPTVNIDQDQYPESSHACVAGVNYYLCPKCSHYYPVHSEMVRPPPIAIPVPSSNANTCLNTRSKIGRSQASAHSDRPSPKSNRRRGAGLSLDAFIWAAPLQSVAERYPQSAAWLVCSRLPRFCAIRPDIYTAACALRESANRCAWA